MASLDTVPITGPGTASFVYVVGTPGPSLLLFKYGLATGPSSQAQFAYTLLAGQSYCWDGLATKLMGYLGTPFTQNLNGKLGNLVRTVARELSVCTETVSFTGSTDARGVGTFTFQVRFEPIIGVSAVQRVDGNGTVLETYTVVRYDTRSITVTGVKPPRPGDLLTVSYSYTHEGLEKRIQEALGELNILTATGEFLDDWGRLFGIPRAGTGRYGSEKYGGAGVGGGKYGTKGVESDSSYSRRILSTVQQTRNTKTAILAAVQAVTGGSPYIVDWCEMTVDRGWVFRPAGLASWQGALTNTSTQQHLIWGQTARFVRRTAGAGLGVFEVWVPRGTGYSTTQLQAIINRFKATGTRGFVRYYN